MEILGRRQQAVLVREKSQEKILLNKPIFRIGRKQQLVDCFIGDNPTVSRIHAHIEIRGNSYVITDCNSVNHTYVNGEHLPAGKAHVLRHGDVSLTVMYSIKNPFFQFGGSKLHALLF